VSFGFEVQLRHAVSGPSPDGSGSIVSDRFSITATAINWDSNGTVVFLLHDSAVAAFPASSVLQVSQNAEIVDVTSKSVPQQVGHATRESPVKEPPERNTVPERHGESWSREDDQELFEAFNQDLKLSAMAERMQRTSRSIELRLGKLLREPSDSDLFEDAEPFYSKSEPRLMDNSFDGGWGEMVDDGHRLAEYMLRDRRPSKPPLPD
jgi:hypothetical protein